MDRNIKKGQVYKHFKGFIITILCVCKHTETMEDMVIYTHDKSDKIWARPLNMFFEEVDHEKYPNVTQKYRFELIKNKED